MRFLLINVYNEYKCCPYLHETVGIRLPSGNFGNFPLFTAGSSRMSCTSTRRASATNTVCKDVDIVCKHLVTLKHILK
jgi:hypothetical protein